MTDSVPNPVEIFRKLDIDGSRYISLDEFEESKAYLETVLGEEFDEISALAPMFDSLDINHDGWIQPNEVDNDLEERMIVDY